MREFESGATRDTDENKIDYEGFLSPAVLDRYGQYMMKHQVQADGNLRESDNWQKGIPIKVYIKSKFRHFVETWTTYRKGFHLTSAEDMATVRFEELEESLCAELFNTMGMLHEVLKLKG